MTFDQIFLKFKKHVKVVSCNNQKSSFSKTILREKIVFEKDDFESIHFSNKHYKSHVWPKNIKK
jgi:hypothetical protein